MKVSLFRLLMLAASVCFLAGTPKSTFAQMDQGRIMGQVVDAKAASIAHATIIVRNERTDEVRTVESNDDGSYQVLALQPSFYTISIKSDGFAPAQMTNVQLSVGQEIRRNFTLQLPSVTQSVEVIGTLEGAIDTSSASMGVNVNERELAELPLNGRQVSQLFLQAPGSQNIGTGTFGEVRLSGRSWEENAIRYDGIEGTNIISGAPGVLNDELNTPFRLQASLENIQEFRIESNNYPAEYGTGSGGQITLITKSGSNAFHGSAFEYLRNDKLDARNFFDSAQKSELRLNQFGGSLGGPIAKDKLFFFGYYEGYLTSAATSCTGRCATTSCTVCWHSVREKPSLGSASMAFPKRSHRWKRRKNKIGFGPWSVFSKENRYRLSPILWAIADVGSTNGSSAREWRTRRSPGQKIDPDVRMLTPGAVRSKWWKP
jgi:hypothetical protein